MRKISAMEASTSVEAVEAVELFEAVELVEAVKLDCCCILFEGPYVRVAMDIPTAIRSITLRCTKEKGEDEEDSRVAG